MSFYDCGLGSDRLTHLSSLPPLQKHRQSVARATSQIFLLHASASARIVTASDPTTGQVPRDSLSYLGRWLGSSQCIALHENIIAFGTGLGVVSIIDVKNRRKLDNRWKTMDTRHEFAVTALFIPPVAIDVPKEDTVVGGGTPSLISGSSAGEIILHDMKTGEALTTYKLPGSPTLPTYMIHYIDYDPATKMIIVGSCAGEIWTVKVNEQNDQLQKLAGTEYVDVVSWETQQDIIIDPETSLMSLAVNIFFLTDFANHSILIIRDTTIHRHSLKSPNVMASFGSDETQVGKYTCAAIDPENQPPDRSRFFAVGNTEGIVSIYDARNVSEDHPILALYFVIPVGPGNTPVTALAINPLVLVTGSQDGTAKVYSTLDGNPLRTLCAPTARRRRLRPPTPTAPELSNSIVAISLTTSPKVEVRGALGFESGYIRYWNFAPEGVGILLRSKKRRRIRDLTARDVRDFVESELERDDEERRMNVARQRRWERMNGGIEEEDVALQVAMMMSREHEEERQRRLGAAGDWHEVPPESGADDVDSSGDEDISEWRLGRKISFGSTSGSASPATRVVAGGMLENAAAFRRGRFPGLPQHGRPRSFEEDLEFAIRLSLAEQEGPQENNSHE